MSQPPPRSQQHVVRQSRAQDHDWRGNQVALAQRGEPQPPLVTLQVSLHPGARVIVVHNILHKADVNESDLLEVWGGLHLNAIIVARAEALGVPMVVAPQDTLTAVEMAEQAFRQVLFDHPQKIA